MAWINETSTLQSETIGGVKSYRFNLGAKGFWPVSAEIANAVLAERNNRIAADNLLSSDIASESARAQSAEALKADRSQVSELVVISLPNGSTSITNASYANKTAVLIDITSGGTGAVIELTFNSSGVASLGFTVSGTMRAILAGTLGDLAKYVAKSDIIDDQNDFSANLTGGITDGFIWSDTQTDQAGAGFSKSNSLINAIVGDTFFFQGIDVTMASASTGLGKFYRSNGTRINGAVPEKSLFVPGDGGYYYTVPSSIPEAATFGLIVRLGDSSTVTVRKVTAFKTDQFYPTLIPPLNYTTPEQVNGKIDPILSNFNSYYEFESGDKIDFTQEYIFDTEGEYIEFEVQLTGTAPNNGLGMLGKFTVSSNSNKLGFRTGTTLALRGTSTGDPYIEWTIPSLISEMNLYRIELVMDSGILKWSLSVNGVEISKQNYLNPLRINNLGTNYSAGNFIGNFKKLIFHTSTQDKTITDFVNEPGSLGVEYIVSLKQSEEANLLPPVFYSYNNSLQELTVYTKYPNSPDKYVGTVVKRTVDATIRQDCWRIYYGTLFTYNGTSMINTGIVLIREDSESENVYQQTGRVSGRTSYVGGYHGNEIFNQFEIFIDGVSIGSPTADIALTSCGYVHYRQKSNMYQAAANGSGVIITPSPIIQALQIKKTSFEEGKVRIKKYIQFDSSVASGGMLMAELFVGLFCTGQGNSEKFYTDRSDIITALNDDQFYFYEQKGSNVINYENITTKLSAKVFTTPINIYQNGINKTKEFLEAMTLTCWDRGVPGNPGDKKYYLRGPWTVYPNDIIETETVYEFRAKL